MAVLKMTGRELLWTAMAKWVTPLEPPLAEPDESPLLEVATIANMERRWGSPASDGNHHPSRATSS